MNVWAASSAACRWQLFEADDQRKPEVAVQKTEEMVSRDGIYLMTGQVWSNLALAMMPTLARNEVFFISPNAGPSQLAGKQCNPWFFNTAWQNDNNHEATGAYAQENGFKKVYLLAPNYPAGKDALTGFKRYYKGGIAGEVYTSLEQMDFAAELANLRAAQPDAVYFFFPGGQGINFIKQYYQAGLKEMAPLLGPAFSFDQDILRCRRRGGARSPSTAASGAPTSTTPSTRSSSPTSRPNTAASPPSTPRRPSTRS